MNAIISRLLEAKKIGIFAHENPDGDALGSSYSLKLVLQGLGKEAEVFLAEKPDEMPYAMVHGKASVGINPADCDLQVAVDCAEVRRLGEHQALFAGHPNTIAIDHHITHVPYAKESLVRDVSSCCEIMAELYREMNVSVTKEIADNLYLGMVCDTGRFQYRGVTSATLQTAAELLDAGASYAEISKKVFNTKSREYYALMQTALSHLQYYQDGKICVLYLSQKDFANAGIEESGAGGIVTLPSSIDGVEVGVYIRERGGNAYKVSLRSEGVVNVAEIAKALGGGGHVCASGYSVENQTVEELVQEVLKLIQNQKSEDLA